MPRKTVRKPRRSTSNPPRESALKIKQREAIERLKDWGISRGDMIYTIVRNVSPSGMQRTIDLYKFSNCDAHGEVRTYFLTNAVAQATGYKVGKNKYGGESGVVVRGAGMDMAAHLVDTLSYAMFGDERALKQRTL